jgi:hypothetical protein
MSDPDYDAVDHRSATSVSASEETSLPAGGDGIIRFDYSALEPDIANEARATAERIQSSLRKSILETGRDLCAIKDKLDHGKFGAWIKAEFSMTMRTATNYMNVVRLARKSETISLLPPVALYALASPSASPAAVNEILAAVESGSPMTAPAIKAKLADAIKTNRDAAEAARWAEIEAAKSPDQIRKEQKARESKTSRLARKERERQAVLENEEHEEQEREARFSPLVQRIAAAITPRDLAALVKVLTSHDFHDNRTLLRLLTATEEQEARHEPDVGR